MQELGVPGGLKPLSPHVSPTEELASRSHGLYDVAPNTPAVL